MILHTVAQKQLHNLPFSAWSDDMKHAQLCLDTLKYCGTIDPVALSFYEFLSVIYDKLLRGGEPEVTEEQARTGQVSNWASMPPDFSPLGKQAATIDPTLPADYLISTPSGCDPKLQELSMSLLVVVCRPWDDPLEAGHAEQNNRGELQQKVSDSEDAQAVKSNWYCEDKHSFRWDSETMGIKGDGVAADCYFMGSEEPSGWSSTTVDVEVDSEDDSA